MHQLGVVGLARALSSKYSACSAYSGISEVMAGAGRRQRLKALSTTFSALNVVVLMLPEKAILTPQICSRRSDSRRSGVPFYCCDRIITQDCPGGQSKGGRGSLLASGGAGFAEGDGLGQFLGGQVGCDGARTLDAGIFVVLDTQFSARFHHS